MAVVWEPEPSSNESDPRRPARNRAGRSPFSLAALTAACGVVVLLAGACTEPPPPAPGSVSSAIVTRVVDGDTIEISVGGQIERVRLLGVDAPESVSPTVPVQCFGPEASQALAQLLPPGAEVRIERDLEARDRFDRLLLYVYRSDDDLFVNEWLIAAGLADTLAFEPNVAFRTGFEAVRRQARAEGVGLWGRCDGPDQPLG